MDSLSLTTQGLETVEPGRWRFAGSRVRVGHGNLVPFAILYWWRAGDAQGIRSRVLLLPCMPNWLCIAARSLRSFFFLDKISHRLRYFFTCFSWIFQNRGLKKISTGQNARDPHTPRVTSLSLSSFSSASVLTCELSNSRARVTWSCCCDYFSEY